MSTDNAQNPIEAVFGNKTLEESVSLLRGYVEKGQTLIPYSMQRAFEQGGGPDEEHTFTSFFGEESISADTLSLVDRAASELLNVYLRAETPNFQHMGKLMEIFWQGDWITGNRGDLLRVIGRVTTETYTDSHYQQQFIRFPLIRSLMGSQKGCTTQERQTLEEFWTRLFNDAEDFPLGYLGIIMLDERKAPEWYPALREKNQGNAPYNADSQLHFDGIAKKYGMTLDHKFDH